LKSFINLSDIDKEELRQIIDSAKKNKKIKTNTNLKGKTLIMIFEKKSLRTRISFELAMKQLGGELLTLNLKDSHYGDGGESIHDTAKVLSQYGDIVMMRANKHENFMKFKKNLDIPIINGLTNLSHPCQIMADVMTFEELKGPIENKKIAWVGDGNNVVYSLIEAAIKFNFQLNIASPKKFWPDKKILNWAKNNNGKIIITKDPKEAVKLVDCVMTDKWISMNDKSNKQKKRKLLKPYQVNSRIMNLAKSDAIFMHCLPANRGEEVTDEVIDGKQSAVWLEAKNRMYVQKSIIEWCLK
tara:strand:+ start:259 stop:1155 length:897 start_codon:yes stop_codon:yes gene_type:complete